MTGNSAFHTTMLSSGVQVVAQPLASVQSAALAFFIGAGARDEEPEVAGLSHLVESTMLRGTTKLSSRELTDELDRLGVSRGSSPGIEMTVLSGVLLGDRLLAALELLVGVLRQPSFPPEDLEAVRQLQLQEIGQREDQPQQLAMDLGRRLYFAGSSLAHDILGTRKTVEQLRREKVLDFHSGRYTANNIVAALAGRFEWEPFVDKLEELTSGWRQGSGRLSAERPGLNVAAEVRQTEMAQENICLMYPGPAYGAPDYYPASIATTVLGGGMNSRLFSEVREKRGLAYSVGARLDGLEQAGLVRIFVGTQPGRARESLEVVRSELEKIERDGVTDHELALAKTRLKSRLLMSSESSGNRVMSIGRDWWYKRRFRTLHQIAEEIDAVDGVAVRRHLSEVRPNESLGLVALGPLSAADLGWPDATQGSTFDHST